MVVTHLTAEAVDIKDVDWTKPTAIVLGNEKDGEALRVAQGVGAATTVATHCHVLRLRRGLKHWRNHRS